MFLFIGVFPREREIAVATFRCEHCHEEAAQHIIETGSRLWLFFIPLLTFSRRYVSVCANCGGVTEVTREFAKRVAHLTAHGGAPRS
ncbi:MAG TPA: zinc-ribbon domain-containing protein [Agromyces mariniharenae]|nr:zinc-ribbon domain-containing protein [Agromyces mariniharenae]